MKKFLISIFLIILSARDSFSMDSFGYSNGASNTAYTECVNNIISDCKGDPYFGSVNLNSCRANAGVSLPGGRFKVSCSCDCTTSTGEVFSMKHTEEHQNNLAVDPNFQKQINIKLAK